jgi:hypothetical protein
LERVPIDLEKDCCRHWLGYFMATGFISVLDKALVSAGDRGGK